MKILGIGKYLGSTKESLKNLISQYGQASEKFISDVCGMQEICVEHKLDQEGMIIEALEDLRRQTPINELIGLVIVVTTTPQYLIPSMGIRVMHHLNLSPEVQQLEINCNCAGVVAAMNLSNSYLREHPNKQVLIISAEHWSIYKDVEVLASSTYADGAFAMKLGYSSKVFEYSQWNKPDYLDELVLPNGGFKEGQNFLKVTNDGHLSLDDVLQPMSTQINKLIQAHNLNSHSLLAICTSQGVQKTIQALDENVLVKDKIPFIAQRVGYLGTGCVPLTLEFVLNNFAHKDGVYKSGYIILCYLGAGIQIHTALLEV